MHPQFEHRPVLLAETVEAVFTRPDGCYVDGTFGRGGHSRALLARLGPQGRLIAFDKDPQAIAAAQAIEDPRFTICHADFAQAPAQLAALGIVHVDGVMLDLGVSSPQIDDARRGFSFRFDGPLDMRMDTTRGPTVADFLASADERHIAQIIRDYGEERFAGPIARAIVARRAQTPLASTAELAQLVAKVIKRREPGQDPATRTFQALRIHINGELDSLSQGLTAALTLLAPGGHLAVISFHSLEDRMVKQFIAHESRVEFDRRAPFAPPTRVERLKALGRIKPSEAEVSANPRSRSAVLRVAERLGAAGQGAGA